MKRVGIAGFLHESNSFSPIPTPYQHFKDTSLTRGEALLARWQGTHHQLGGFLEGAREFQFEPVPLLATYGVPSAPLPSDSFEQLAADLTGALRAALPLDGLLVALHGAAVAENYPDADGELAARFRQVLGTRIPILAVIDLHANISDKMARNTNGIVVYRSNPHLDQRERGLEAAGLMAQTLRGDVAPVQALERPPLLLNITRQYTEEAPAKELYRDVQSVLSWPGILSASTAMGFYYSDVEEMGASFLAIADGDRELARKAARWLAERAWRRRREFLSPLPGPAEAVRSAAREPHGPVVLLDVGDNVGGGSPGDSTILLEEIVRQQASGALVVLYDPEAVSACVQRGVRQSIELPVGAKSDAIHGRPVRVSGRIRSIADGRSTESRPRHGGQGFFDQGVTAVLETPRQNTLVLTSIRMAPRSLEQLWTLGLRPEQKKILVVKGVVAPRAAYEPIARRTILVDTPGSTSANPAHFSYRNVRRSLYPLQENLTYPE